MIYISGEHEDGKERIKTRGTGYDRCIILGTYMIEHNATVRQTAQKFGISKSTVHKDVTETLKHLNPSLHVKVRSVLEINKQERHLRGGEATRRKYIKERQL